MSKHTPWWTEKKSRKDEFIDKRLSAYNELVAMLTAYVDMCEDDDQYPAHNEEARALLAKLEGEKE